MFPRHRRILIAGVVASALMSGIAPAAAPPDRDAIQRLVIQLRSADFAERQAAEAAIARAGAESLPVLESMVDQVDPESRYRLSRVISHLRQAQLHEALAALESGERPSAVQLPGWSRFAHEFGVDAPALTLFAAMVRAEPHLLEALGPAADEGDAKLEFERRCAELFQRRRTSIDETSVATIAALLFAGTDDSCLPSGTAASCVHALTQSRKFEEAMLAGPQSESLRDLTVAWILRSESSTPAQRLDLAARYDLAEGVYVAREIIDSRIHDQQIRAAILFLAKHGRTNAIMDLEELLDDETELRGVSRSRNKTFSCLVRDVALVGLLHMTKQDPQLYGFEELRDNREYLFNLQSIGFRDDETRKAAFDRWSRWRAQNLRKAQPLPTQAVEGIAL